MLRAGAGEEDTTCSMGGGLSCLGCVGLRTGYVQGWFLDPMCWDGGANHGIARMLTPAAVRKWPWPVRRYRVVQGLQVAKTTRE